MSAPARAKVLAVSSPGGHWVQLTRICRKLEDRHDIVYASPRSQYQLSAKDQCVVHNILDAAADKKWRLLPLVFQVLYLIAREHPNVIISTGAAPGVVAILLGKVLGRRTVWIDSIANVESLSSSGRMVQRYTDVVLTQWEPLSDDESILYRGAVL